MPNTIHDQREPGRAVVWWLALVACLFLAGMSPVHALTADELYQAEVPVKDQSRKGRFAVYPAALSQVVVKLTGDRHAPELPALRSFMANAVRMVQQFSYRELPDDQPLLTEEYAHLLVVNFDREGVRKALIEAGVPIWAHTRPTVLLWLAIEDRGSRYLLAAGQSAEIQGQLERVAQQRGLPVMLPLLDLDDQMTLNFADVWGDFQGNILRASQRYGADVVLVGRMYRSHDGQWQARWSLYDADGSRASGERWLEDANDQPSALATGIDGAADRIARRDAQVYSPGEGDTVSIKITAIRDVAAYARAMQYLQALDMVTAVQASRVFDDEVLFHLTLQGEQQGLVRAIALGDVLKRQTVLTDTPDAQAYVYQLVP